MPRQGPLSSWPLEGPLTLRPPGRVLASASRQFRSGPRVSSKAVADPTRTRMGQWPLLGILAKASRDACHHRSTAPPRKWAMPSRRPPLAPSDHRGSAGPRITQRLIGGRLDSALDRCDIYATNPDFAGRGCPRRREILRPPEAPLSALAGPSSFFTSIL